MDFVLYGYGKATANAGKPERSRRDHLPGPAWAISNDTLG